MDNYCIKREDVTGVPVEGRAQQLAAAIQLATQMVSEKDDIIEELKHKSGLLDSIIKEQDRTIYEQDRLIERKLLELAQLNHQLRETSMCGSAVNTPAPPLPSEVASIVNALGVSPVTNTLAAVPAVIAPAADRLAPGFSVASASADVDATNAASTKEKKSLSAIRRQRLRVRTVTERQIKKKQGNRLEN
ncbi:hypothetical protein GGH93_005567 [Coemansia aciculifera]|nr:hypothetical protein GGH93_005567 [Coemansia aciculifera]